MGENTTTRLRIVSYNSGTLNDKETEVKELVNINTNEPCIMIFQEHWRTVSDFPSKLEEILTPSEFDRFHVWSIPCKVTQGARRDYRSGGCFALCHKDHFVKGSIPQGEKFAVDEIRFNDESRKLQILTVVVPHSRKTMLLCSVHFKTRLNVEFIKTFQALKRSHATMLRADYLCVAGDFNLGLHELIPSDYPPKHACEFLRELNAVFFNL